MPIHRARLKLAPPCLPHRPGSRMPYPVGGARTPRGQQGSGRTESAVPRRIGSACSWTPAWPRTNCRPSPTGRDRQRHRGRRRRGSDLRRSAGHPTALVFDEAVPRRPSRRWRLVGGTRCGIHTLDTVHQTEALTARSLELCRRRGTGKTLHSQICVPARSLTHRWVRGQGSQLFPPSFYTESLQQAFHVFRQGHLEVEPLAGDGMRKT